MRVGIIGKAQALLARAGAAGLEAVAHAPTAGAGPALGGTSPPSVPDYQGFLDLLDHPRIYLLDLDPGPGVDAVVDEAYASMEPGDVVVDLTGSYWGDTLRRYRRMRHRSLYYVDAALIDDTAAGPSLLLAGDPRGVELAAPPLAVLASPGTLVPAGAAGAAHYALMLHDAWRTALSQAASEIHQALEAYPTGAAAPELLHTLTGGVADGRGPRASWLLDDAVRLEAATPLLAQAVMLELATALEELRTSPPPVRVGGFVHPEEIS